jgi:osmotically-inducible protein OsmY
VDASGIGVAATKCVVTLTGFVDSCTAKLAAERAARRVHGVKAVANDIQVKLPNEDRRTDTDIAAAAINVLKWDAAVPMDRVQVTVSEGWVTLKGEVDWQFQKEAAEREVRNLKGVLGVTNLISVSPRVKPSDVKKKIEDALLRSVKTDAERIDVDVQGTRVVLKGKVRSFAEKEEAERAAWQAPGITSVDDQIVVSYY